MTLEEIKELIQMMEDAGMGELRLERDGFKIHLKSKAYVKALLKNQSRRFALPPQAVQPPPVQAIQPQEALALQPTKTTPQATEKTGLANGSNGQADGSDAVNGSAFRSPMIGTFYRSPAPGKDPFVKIGDTISKGDVLCIIEAMKLFNEILAEEDCKIVKVMAEDSTPVEYDQPLFLLEPLG